MPVVQLRVPCNKVEKFPSIFALSETLQLQRSHGHFQGIKQ